MSFLIDSDVAIHWRDDSDPVVSRIAALSALPFISAISRVELENGVYRDPSQTAARRVRLDALLAQLPVIDFTEEVAAEYGRILAKAGYSRPRTNDRMIAATALVHDLTLITMNGADYRDIPGLTLEIWPSPAP